MEFLIDNKYIDKKKRSSRTGCPIAQKLKELFPGKPVQVGSTYAFVGDREFAMDKKTIEIVEKFDRSGKMQPFLARLIG